MVLKKLFARNCNGKLEIISVLPNLDRLMKVSFFDVVTDDWYFGPLRFVHTYLEQGKNSTDDQNHQSAKRTTTSVKRLLSIQIKIQMLTKHVYAS